MKKILVNSIKGILVLMEMLLAGCTTSLFNKPKGPFPEDTIAQREPISHHDAICEYTLATPMRPEPEPEEVFVFEPEMEEIQTEPVPKAKGAEYTVRKGDCLCWLAKKYSIPLQDLLNANSFSRNTKLFIGQKIILPDITQEQLNQTQMFPMEYVVQKSDCLSKIANKFGLKVQEIKMANNMKNDRIVAGKKIIIPERGRYKDYTLPKTKLTSNSKKETFVIDDEGYYTVRKGDVLSTIASNAKVSVSNLQNWNNLLDPSKIHVGQKLMVKQKPSHGIIASIAQSSPSNNLRSETSNAVVATQEIPDKRYNFVEDDVDFFNKVDHIPIIQVHD